MIISILSLLLSTTITSNQALAFENIVSHMSTNEQATLQEKEINSFEDLERIEPPSRDLGYSNSEAYELDELESALTNSYPGYYWFSSNYVTTEYASNAIPINMQGNLFPKTDIELAIVNSGVESSYGGCGPIALMGILDYFARYLGYSNIMANPTSSLDRIQLATDVLNTVSTYELGFIVGEDATFTFPWDYSSAFNSLTTYYGSSNISSTYQWTLLGGEYSNYWETIVSNINRGLPVTLMTTLCSGNGEFSGHYTNIYGYDTWVGYNSVTGDRIEKNYIIARLNWENWNSIYYCSAEILNDAMISVITYNVSSSSNYTIYANDFSNDFVNNNGNGQYFFYDKACYVTVSSGQTIYTHRLRCSYIENQYLVMSPNREGAGTAYLDIEFPNYVNKIAFDSWLWSNNEVVFNQTFQIQIYKNGSWIDHTEYDLHDFTSSFNYPDSFYVLFPKNTYRIRFITINPEPVGTRNKGRVLLDNIRVNY